MYFSVFSASAHAFLGPPYSLIGDGRMRVRPSLESMTSPPEWVMLPSSMALKNFEAKAMYSNIFSTNNAFGTSVAEREAKIIESCQAMAVRGCVEYEFTRKFDGQADDSDGFTPIGKASRRNINPNLWWVIGGELQMVR